MYCIRCDSVVRPLFHDNEIELFDVETTKSDILTIEGVIEDIRVGYGSKFDGHKILICICDKCIELTINNGTTLVLDEMFSLKSQKNSIEKSKKVFSRRRKLDDLELE
jgi:hypothetical protein